MKRAELIALCAALVALAAILLIGFERPAHAVLIEWPSSPPGVELTPRLDALAVSAQHAARAGGPSVVQTLADAASRSGWTVVEGRGGPEAVLDGAVEALRGAGRVVVVLHLDAVGPAALDAQLARVLDGLAPALAPSRTLYLIERSDEVYAIGPGQRRLRTPVDGLTARDDLRWTLRLR